MNKNRTPRLILIVGLIIFCGMIKADAKPVNPVTVDIWQGNALLSNETVQVRFESNPLKLTVTNGNTTVFKTADRGFLSLDSGDRSSGLRGTNIIQRLFNGFRATLKDRDGRSAYMTVRLDSSGQVRMDVDPISGTVDGISVNLTQGEEEHYYGLGDVWHTAHVDLKGSKVELWDQTGTPDECNYVPFYMSTGGYGLFIDNSYYGFIDFGKTDKRQTVLHFDAPSLSMHLWVGDTMKDILPRYLDYTGYPPMPPKWTFLPQKWRDAGTWDEVFEDVRLMKEHDMPLGAVWLDRPWMHGEYGSDDFIFDKQRYPDPQKHIQKLHDMGIRLIVWGCDFLTKDSEHFEEGKRNGYFVGGFGVHNDENDLGRYLVDFANPEAREWFKDMIKHALKLGVDGIKLDRGQKYPVNVVPPSGRDPQAMHNYHSYLMVKTYAEALQEIRGNDYQFTPRAGWAGTQAWTMKWPGDMNSDFSHDQGLPAVVRAQSDAGLTGFALWGSDIGGYGEDLSKEVFVRWLQHGTFSPLMQIPGKGNHNKAPFSWDDDAVRIYKFYAQLRENMIPYLVDQARIAHEQGTPIVQHLAWNWPDDPKVHSRDYEYMFGSDLLVACVVKKARTRTVYLPKGTWVDFWNRDRIIEGPATLREEVPLWKIPVYIRKGSGYKFSLPDVNPAGE